MFEKLNYILLAVVLVIVIFFVVSSFSFSGRLAEGMYAENTKQSCIDPILRLCRKNMEEPMVAA